MELAVLCRLSHVWRFVTLWTVAHQAPLSMGFSRQEYCHGFSCPPPGYLPDPVIEPATLASPALAGRFFTTSATWEEWDLIKLKTFAQQRKLSKMKRLPSEWEKNNRKWNNWQKINLQNIQAAHAAQYQKNKQPNQNADRRPKQTFLQRRHTDG